MKKDAKYVIEILEENEFLTFDFAIVESQKRGIYITHTEDGWKKSVMLNKERLDELIQHLSEMSKQISL